MVYGVNFGDKHSFRDWQLTMEERPVISPPLPKVIYVEVPGLDAFIDMTETLTGDVNYQSRTIEFTFTTRKVRQKWNKLYSDIASYLHGQRMKIILDEDKGYFYIGRVSVNEWKSDIKYSTIVIEAEVDPYKYERYGSLERWVWDVFPFEGGIIREYKDLEVNGEMILIVPGRRKKVVPVFDCSAAMQLEYGGKTYYLPAGKSKIIDLQLGVGEHFLRFHGHGIVSVDYRGASL